MGSLVDWKLKQNSTEGLGIGEFEYNITKFVNSVKLFLPISFYP